MKKVLLLIALSVALVATTIGLATAGTNLITLRNAANEVLSSSDFNPSTMSFDRDFLQIKQEPGGTYTVAIAMATRFHKQGASREGVSIGDWGEADFGLAANYLDNKPALKGFENTPMLGHLTPDNPDVIVWSGVRLPQDGKPFVLTFPVRSGHKGSWKNPDSHEWAWTQWNQNACFHTGERIGVGMRYISSALRFEPVGMATPAGEPDARTYSAN